MNRCARTCVPSRVTAAGGSVGCESVRRRADAGRWPARGGFRDAVVLSCARTPRARDEAMTGWIASMMRFRALVIALAAGLLVVGIAQLRKAPVDVLPEYTQPYVQVQTEALGLSAAEIEQ